MKTTQNILTMTSFAAVMCCFISASHADFTCNDVTATEVPYADITLGWGPCGEALVPTWFDIAILRPDGGETSFVIPTQRGSDGAPILDSDGHIPIHIGTSYLLALGRNEINYRSRCFGPRYKPGGWNKCVCNLVPPPSPTPIPKPTTTRTPIPEPSPTPTLIDPGEGTILSIESVPGIGETPF